LGWKFAEIRAILMPCRAQRERILGVFQLAESVIGGNTLSEELYY